MSHGGEVADHPRLGTIGWIQIDCRDPDALRRFWAGLLGMENDPSPAPPAFRCLLGINGGTGLCFQRVPESKTIKNRMHLDVIVDDLASATRWVEENGGQRRSAAPDFHEGEWRWRIMADPEGNEFCFVPVSN